MFSLCVRERSDWTCEKCRTKFEERAQNLHCSHLYSRRYRSIRWHPLGAVAHCFSCHMWFGSNPIEAAEWVRLYLGESKFDELRSLVQTICKTTQKDRDRIYQRLRHEHERMKQMRADGVTGRIEFDSPYEMVVA